MIERNRAGPLIVCGMLFGSLARRGFMVMVIERESVVSGRLRPFGASFSSDASSYARGLAPRGQRRPSCFQTRIDGFDFLFEPWPSSFSPSFATSVEPFDI